MANRAYLLAVEDPAITWSNDPGREVLAEGINEIPVYWASLFAAEDRRIDTYAGEDGRTEIPNWCVESKTAKRRLKALQDPVAGLLRDQSGQLWTQWIGLINNQRARFLKTNAAEVWNLDAHGYDAYWATLLRAFSKPSARTMKAAAARNGLEYSGRRIAWGYVEETLCKLAGAEHIRKLPWFNEHLSDYYAPPDESGERRNIYDEIYDAISPDDSLEDAVRKAREMLNSAPRSRRRT